MQDEARRSEFDNETFADAFPPGVEKNFWNLARNWIVEGQMVAAVRAGILGRTSPILEIGCGSGVVVKHLRDRNWNTFGSELGAPPLIEGIEGFVWTSGPAANLNTEFRRSVQCILLLDVIEHIQDDEDFLRVTATDFPNCGCFILTVPARQEAWSNYDQHFGHFRRYTLATLQRTVNTSGLTMARQSYFFHSLYVAAMAANMLKTQRNVHLSATKRPALDRLIARLLRLESLLIPRSVPGLSIIATATREAPACRRIR